MSKGVCTVKYDGPPPIAMGIKVRRIGFALQTFSELLKLIADLPLKLEG